MTLMNQYARVRSSRRGTMLVEIIVSAAMLGTLLIIINQMVVRLHKQSAALDKHRFAQVTLENLLEEFTALEWSEISTESISQLSLSDLAKSKLHQVTLEGDVELEQEPVPAKRVQLRMSWQGESGVAQSLGLATWVFQSVEDEP